MAGARPGTSPDLGGASKGAPIPRDAVLLASAIFLFVSATNLLTPLVPMVRLDLGVSIATAGLIVGSYGFARLMADIPSGFLSDRFGHRRLSIFSVLLLIASSCVGVTANSVEVLIAARVGSGIAVGFLATIILSALSATATTHNRGKVMSLFHVANNTGIAVYPLIGGVIGATLGWRETFLATASLSVVGAVLLLSVLPRIDFTRGGRRGSSDESRVLHGRQRTVASLSTHVGVVANMIHRHGFRNTVLPLYAATSLALGGVSIATAIALMSVTGLMVATPGGMLGDRIGRRRVITAGLAAVAAGDLAFMLSHDLLTFILLAALIGFGDFFTSSQTALLSEIVPAADRTRSLAGYRFSSDLGALLGPIVLAAVMDSYGAHAAILTAVGVLFAASAIAWIGVPARVENPATHEPALAPVPLTAQSLPQEEA